MQFIEVRGHGLPVSVDHKLYRQLILLSFGDNFDEAHRLSDKDILLMHSTSSPSP